MGRDHRLDHPGALHHLTNAGVGGRNIFRTEEEARQNVCGKLSEVVWVNASGGTCNGPKGNVSGEPPRCDPLAQARLLAAAYVRDRAAVR